MPTTARGIWTPSDTDAVDFTTHLATMAGTIDTAITNGLNTIDAGANAFKGTAAQRTAFLSTAVNGMLWQDTDGIKMIWRKDGAAWVPAVWRWSGTTAQMNSFGANAPDGFEWFSTTDNSNYVRLGAVWTGGNSVLGYGSITSPDQMGITGTATTITGISISFALTGPARVKVTGQLRGNGSSATTAVEHGLRDNGSQVLAWTRGANSGNTASLTSSQAVTGVLNLASGSHTFTMTSRVVAGGGTYNSRPQPGEPIYLLIELVA